jgi:hypothetical protein
MSNTRVRATEDIVDAKRVAEIAEKKLNKSQDKVIPGHQHIATVRSATQTNITWIMLSHSER